MANIHILLISKELVETGELIHSMDTCMELKFIKMEWIVSYLKNYIL